MKRNRRARLLIAVFAIAFGVVVALEFRPRPADGVGDAGRENLSVGRGRRDRDPRQDAARLVSDDTVHAGGPRGERRQAAEHDEQNGGRNRARCRHGRW